MDAGSVVYGDGVIHIISYILYILILFLCHILVQVLAL